MTLQPTAVALVPSVATVVVAVTQPRGVDADGGVGALHLIRSADCVICNQGMWCEGNNSHGVTSRLQGATYVTHLRIKLN